MFFSQTADLVGRAQAGLRVAGGTATCGRAGGSQAVEDMFLILTQFLFKNYN